MNETKASRYHRLKRRAGLASVLSTAGLLALLLWSGGSAVLRDAAGSLSSIGPVRVGIYVLILAALLELPALPLTFYATSLLERRYELSSEPPAAWLWDHLKAFALTTALLCAAAEAVYLLIAWSPGWWWLPAWLLGSGAAIALAGLTPVLLLPVFYTFTPLQRDGLAQRLIALSRKAGVPVLGVYEWGLGAKTRRANAALVGAGTTRRILLSDTLLAAYTDDEIEVILAHELAHHVHRDIPRSLALEAALMLAGSYAGAQLLARLWQPLGLRGPADVAGLPLLLLAAGAVLALATPLVNAFSRRNERRADRFALDLTRRADAFASAMRRLASQNLVEEAPSRPVVWLLHSHPPIGERIEAARASSR